MKSHRIRTCHSLNQHETWLYPNLSHHEPIWKLIVSEPVSYEPILNFNSSKPVTLWTDMKPHRTQTYHPMNWHETSSYSKLSPYEPTWNLITLWINIKSHCIRTCQSPFEPILNLIVSEPVTLWTDIKPQSIQICHLINLNLMNLNLIKLKLVYLLRDFVHIIKNTSII